MGKIPFNRKLTYLLFLGLAPIFLVGANFFLRMSEQKRVENDISLSFIELEEKNRKDLYNRLIRAHYKAVDHFYIDKQLEKYLTLSKEVDILQQHIKSGFHPDEFNIKKRLDFLNGNDNKLSFVESSKKIYTHFNETVEALSHPIEIGVSDLTAILTRIEGQQIGENKLIEGKPHLIIADFRIEKKKAMFGECYLLNMKIIKREYSTL